ncbi:hypothetical protein UPYG_G00244000 [Umbra pygmaea]|uniref:C-type lectin domain-containing protein n=1 Tax=Umbra pygmaea TaxID=75934 RepID=A0ABD0WL98_UMBPY
MEMLSTLMMLSAAFVLADAAEPKFRVCPYGWHGYGTHCYLYVHFKACWTNAERNCLRLGGNLASVHSLEQYRFLLNVIERSAKRDQQTWIGGNDAVQEGFWVWSNGSRFHFRNWSRGQPSDSSRRRENCLEMNYGADRGLNDAFCWHKHPFLCSRQL